MANEPIITVVGNLADDPELRFTPSGAPVCNFRVLSTPRTKQGDEWVDGEVLALGCAVWRQYAENAAETLRRGMQVIVQGRMKARTYETREGDKRTVFELDVEHVGPALQYATAQVVKATRGHGGQQGGGQPAPPQQAAAPQNDPWATPSASAAPAWAQ